MRAVLDVILIVLDLYVWLLIAAAILSWLVAFNVVNSRNQVVAMVGDFLYRVTEPVLRPLRNMLPRVGGGIGTATNWKQITAIVGSGYDSMGWVPEGQRSGTMSYSATLKSSTYMTLGEEDYATPIAMAEALHRGIGGSTLAILHGARHLTPLEQPERVAAALQALLQAQPVQ